MGGHVEAARSRAHDILDKVQALWDEKFVVHVIDPVLASPRVDDVHLQVGQIIIIILRSVAL